MEIVPGPAGRGLAVEISNWRMATGLFVWSVLFCLGGSVKCVWVIVGQGGWQAWWARSSYSEAALGAFVCVRLEGRDWHSGGWDDEGILEGCVWIHKNRPVSVGCFQKLKIPFPCAGEGQDEGDVKELHAFVIKILRKDNEDQGPRKCQDLGTLFKIWILELSQFSSVWRAIFFFPVSHICFQYFLLHLNI